MLLAATLAGSVTGNNPAAAETAGERRATLFYSGSVRGKLEPCGCTSDPLGDVARLTGVVRRAGGPGQVLLVDAGNLLYDGPKVPPRSGEGADLAARFLATELGRLPLGGVALGEADLARGPERVLPKRLAANLGRAPFLTPSRLEHVGGIKIGIVGVADPALGRRLGLQVEEPAVAAARESTRLRAAGAEVIVVVAGLERAAARQVARSGGADFVVVGSNPGEGLVRADQIGEGYIVAPADEMQKLGRIDLVLREPPAAGQRMQLVDAGGPEARAEERRAVAARLAQIEAELQRWQTDPAAERAFVEERRKERADLMAKHTALAGDFVAPKTGSYFVNQLIPLRRALPRDPRLAAAMQRLNQQVSAANLARTEPPPVAPPGRAAFVGDAACARCHKPAMTFWKTTVHARAWKTIVDDRKTGFPDCVSCHVTGYGEVGGSSLGHTQRLTNVQCETCHGPGSLHVKAEGLEEPPAVKLSTSEATCQRCHNEKHSDTFQFAAYLRDVLGPGHGAAARQELGPGPTGHQLRSKAVAAARAAGRAQVENQMEKR
jgi:hypothetical protein